MGYVDDWKSAKKKYDAAYKDAFKKLKPVEEHYNAAQFFVEATKTGKGTDEKYLKRKIGKWADKLDFISATRDLKRLTKEMYDLRAVSKREMFGMETVLRDFEKIVLAGEKMIEKGITDAGKWDKYRHVQRAGATKLAKVTGRFNDFVRIDRCPAKDVFKQDLNKIINDIGQRSQTVRLHWETNILGKTGPIITVD